MAGVCPAWMLKRRDGMLPMLFLTTRTPMNAPDWPTVPIVHTSSVMIFQISWPMVTRSSGVAAKPWLKRSSTALTLSGGSIPCSPPVEYQMPKPGPDAGSLVDGNGMVADRDRVRRCRRSARRRPAVRWRHGVCSTSVRSCSTTLAKMPISAQSSLTNSASWVNWMKAGMVGSSMIRRSPLSVRRRKPSASRSVRPMLSKRALA